MPREPEAHAMIPLTPDEMKDLREKAEAVLQANGLDAFVLALRSYQSALDATMALRLLSSHDHWQTRAVTAERALSEAREVIGASGNALRSYQFGNASTELAQEIADYCDGWLNVHPAPERRNEEEG